MHIKSRLNVLLGLAVFGFFSCTHNPDLTNVRTVSFKSEVLPIFQTNCSMCHGSEKHDAELNLTTYDGVASAVTAGNADKSRIYKAITSTISIMPPTPHPVLNQDQRSLIYVWINQGAQNN